MKDQATPLIFDEDSEYMEDRTALTNVRSKTDEVYSLEFEKQQVMKPRLQDSKAAAWDELIKDFYSGVSSDSQTIVTTETAEEIKIVADVEVYFEEDSYEGNFI